VRIVIDTNVILSGLLWHGPPHALLGQIRAGTLELAISPALLDELSDVIVRPKFAAILRLTTRTPERIVDELRTLADVVAAPPLPEPICRDPDDDAVLACAVAARADLIVSGDGDLLMLQAFQGIPIVTAAEALQRLDVQE
jgi:putative PIN family toxin of toxin-antitoxin system